MFEHTDSTRGKISFSTREDGKIATFLHLDGEKKEIPELIFLESRTFETSFFTGENGEQKIKILETDRIYQDRKYEVHLDLIPTDGVYRFEHLVPELEYEDHTEGLIVFGPPVSRGANWYYTPVTKEFCAFYPSEFSEPSMLRLSGIHKVRSEILTEGKFKDWILLTCFHINFETPVIFYLEPKTCQFVLG